MLTQAQATEEVNVFRVRLDDLYTAVKNWVVERHPDAAFHQTQTELSEEATGVYQLHSLEVAMPGMLAVRFVPRGIFMVGAHGRVEARSRLGREVLVWVEAGGPYLNITERVGEVETFIGRPIFAGVAEGWAWSDSKRAQLLPLDREVFWQRVVEPLAR